MKIYNICCVSAEMPYLGNFWFLRYGLKCSLSIRLQDFLIDHISRSNQWNSPIFCMLIQIHINSELIKTFWGGHSQKWARPVWSPDPKIYCILRMNRWNDFWVGVVKNELGHLVHETLKSAEWVYELRSLSAGPLWGNSFWLDQHHTLYLWHLNTSLLQLHLLILWSWDCSSPLLSPAWVFSWNWIIRFLWILASC